MQSERQRYPNGDSNDWIGVRAAWQLYSDNPFEHLICLTPEELSTHCLLLGKTGKGKTTLIHHIIAQDLARNHGICVLDLRGDLVSAAIELCARLTDPRKVRIINLRRGAMSSGFNPLFGSGEAFYRALAVLSAVRAASDSFGVQLAETLMYALLALTEAGGCIPDLEPLFYDRAFRAEIVAKIETDRVRAFWERFEEMTPERQSTLAMPVLNKVSVLFATPSLQRILSEPCPFDLKTHLDTPGSVTLVSLAADETHDAGTMMGSLVLAAVCREVFARVAIPESHRAPLRFIVDEFENFASKEFESLLAEGRRLKTSLLLAHQTLAQTPPKLRSIVLGNVGVKGVFGLGREDSATMSKDLFGSLSAYDFTDLPRGYLVLERRDQPTIEVEVNEPLLRDVAALSSTAEEYLAQLEWLALRPQLVRRPVTALAEPVSAAATPPLALLKVKHRPNLEEWL